MPPRTPRTIAEEKNDSSKFATPDDYDAVAGVPAGVSQPAEERDYRANPVNPPEPAAPARSLKGGG